MQMQKVWTLDEVKADWARVKCEVAYVRMLFAARDYRLAVERSQKFNPYHDDAGRFTTADGVGSGGAGSDTIAGGPGNDRVQVAQAEEDGSGALNAPASGTNRRSEITSRGSPRANTLSDAWNKAEPGPNGGRMCTNGCGRELMVPPNSGAPRDWDLGHNPSWSNRTFLSGTGRSDVRNNYQNGTELECVTCNRSGGNNDSRFSRRAPLVEGDGGRREVAPIGGGGGGGGALSGRNLQTNK
jgi:HNH/ENDO VII superfamily nuclease with conserved GHE residues